MASVADVNVAFCRALFGLAARGAQEERGEETQQDNARKTGHSGLSFVQQGE